MSSSPPNDKKKPAPAQKMLGANSVARALVHIGDRWSLLIIGAAFLGVHRFGEWRQAIGVASNILTNRLVRLVDIGCLRKESTNGRGHESYKLTRMGADLFPTALMFWRFDRLWSKRRGSQRVTLTHTKCGQVMTPTLVCGHCREEVHPREVRYVAGPGAKMEPRPPPKSSRRSNETLNNSTLISSLFGEAIDFFGDRWTQLVMASFFLGDRRYEDIRARWHLAPNVLADRLKLLVEEGMLERRVYQTNPDRKEYILTAKGMGVYPIVLTLNQWGDRWLAGRHGPPLALTHLKCGGELHPIAVCDGCGEPLKVHEVRFAAQEGEPPAPAGPGAVGAAGQARAGLRGQG